MSAFDDAIAARTIYGEARGESDEGQRAVAWVIRNRLATHRWGRTVAAVCLAPAQFSCWNPKDPNRRMLLEINEAALPLMYLAWRTNQPDPTHGATHYQVVGTNAPWSAGRTPVVTIGHHAFYTDIA